MVIFRKSTFLVVVEVIFKPQIQPITELQWSTKVMMISFARQIYHNKEKTTTRAVYRRNTGFCYMQMAIRAKTTVTKFLESRKDLPRTVKPYLIVRAVAAAEMQVLLPRLYALKLETLNPTPTLATAHYDDDDFSAVKVSGISIANFLN